MRTTSPRFPCLALPSLVDRGPLWSLAGKDAGPEGRWSILGWTLGAETARSIRSSLAIGLSACQRAANDGLQISVNLTSTTVTVSGAK